MHFWYIKLQAKATTHEWPIQNIRSLSFFHYILLVIGSGHKQDNNIPLFRQLYLMRHDTILNKESRMGVDNEEDNDDKEEYDEYTKNNDTG